MISANVDPEKVVSLVTTFWRQKKDERTEKEDIWRECWLAYNAKFGKTWENVKRYRSRRYIPVSTQAVDAVGSHIVQGLMPHENWFRVEGRTPDDQTSAKVMTNLMRWQHFRASWRSNIARAVKQAAIFGNVPWAVLWKEDIRFVPNTEKFAGDLGAFAIDGQNPENQRPQMELMPKRQFDGPEFIIHNIFDTVVDRRPDDPDTGLIVLKMVKSKAYVQAMSNPDPSTGYRMYEGVDELTSGSQDNETSDSIRQEIDQALGFYNIPKDGVELLVAWGDFEVDGEVYPNHVATVANRTKLIRFEPNPFWHGKRPWNMFVMTEDPIELYGKGILESNLGIQDWINVTMNQVIEARAHLVNPEYEVVNDGLFDVENWESGPGNIHLVSQPNSIRPIVKPDQTGIGMETIGFAMAQFNEFTGAMKAFTTQDYQKSATEVNAIAGMVNSRFAELVRHFENKLIVPALEMQIQLNQQMMDEPVWIRVVEPQQGMNADPMTGQPLSFDSNQPARLKVSPEDVQGEFDLFPVGASWVAKNQQALQQAVQFTQMIAQSPAQNVIKWNAWAKTVLEDTGYQDAYRFVKSDQELMYEQQQAALAAQMQQQMGQQPGPGGSEPPQGSTGNRGPQSMAGAPGAAPGGGAGNGPVVDTPGGPQRS